MRHIQDCLFIPGILIGIHPIHLTLRPAIFFEISQNPIRIRLGTVGADEQRVCDIDKGDTSTARPADALHDRAENPSDPWVRLIITHGLISLLEQLLHLVSLKSK